MALVSSQCLSLLTLVVTAAVNARKAVVGMSGIYAHSASRRCRQKRALHVMRLLRRSMGCLSDARTVTGWETLHAAYATRCSTLMQR